MNEGLNISDNLLEKTIGEINILKQEVATMGANDFEIPTFNKIIENLKNGKCSPEDAIKEAMKIRSSKQDYH